MIEIKRILFPTDFSRCAEQALTHAIHLTKLYQAELHVLHAVVLHGYTDNNPEYGFANIESIHRWMEHEASNHMSSILESLERDQLRIKRAQMRGISAAPVILEYAKEFDVDLIILGTHGRRGLGHLFLGSVAEEVVRLAPCPVLTIRERKEPTPIEELDRILVPIDFSEHSKNALKYAKQMAASYDSRLQLLHVTERAIPPSFYAFEKYQFLDPMETIRNKSKEATNRFLQETEGPELAAEIHVIEGRAAADISDFAKDHHSDLIVIATHGLTGIEHLLMGSVTEKVVRRASCPVFTVKSFGKNLIRGKKDIQLAATGAETSLLV
jgi:nucleotide-binding universal stress UspA family protein